MDCETIDKEISSREYFDLFFNPMWRGVLTMFVEGRHLTALVQQNGGLVLFKALLCG